MSDSYKHMLEVASRFNKSVKRLNEGVKRQLKKMIEELLNGQHSGKSLKGPYREFKVVRIGKYRLIYSDKEPCKIVLHDIKHQEITYI